MHVLNCLLLHPHHLSGVGENAILATGGKEGNVLTLRSKLHANFSYEFQTPQMGVMILGGKGGCPSPPSVDLWLGTNSDT